MDKVISAMTSAQNPHRGQEQTILQLYTSMYHWGAIVVALGFRVLLSLRQAVILMVRLRLWVKSA